MICDIREKISLFLLLSKSFDFIRRFFFFSFNGMGMESKAK